MIDRKLGKHFNKLYQLKSILYQDKIDLTRIEVSIAVKYPEFIPYLENKKLLFQKINNLIDYNLDLVIWDLRKLGDKNITKEDVLKEIDEELKHAIVIN